MGDNNIHARTNDAQKIGEGDASHDPGDRNGDSDDHDDHDDRVNDDVHGPDGVGDDLDERHGDIACGLDAHHDGAACGPDEFHGDDCGGDDEYLSVHLCAADGDAAHDHVHHPGDEKPALRKTG